jgi:hypothetical protein
MSYWQNLLTLDTDYTDAAVDDYVQKSSGKGEE